MEAIIEGAVLAQLRLPITVGIIVCGLRDKDPSVTAALAGMHGVCGRSASVCTTSCSYRLRCCFRDCVALQASRCWYGTATLCGVRCELAFDSPLTSPCIDCM
jgi:hypothetical protein